jgi:hypothetical protein
MCSCVPGRRSRSGCRRLSRLLRGGHWRGGIRLLVLRGWRGMTILCSFAFVLLFFTVFLLFFYSLLFSFYSPSTLLLFLLLSSWLLGFGIGLRVAGWGGSRGLKIPLYPYSAVLLHPPSLFHLPLSTTSSILYPLSFYFYPPTTIPPPPNLPLPLSPPLPSLFVPFIHSPRFARRS